MSYEPTLIIKKKDLNSKKVVELLEKEQYSKIEEKANVAEYLLEVNQRQTIKFDELEIVICRPELTTFNRLVRQKLQKLKVDFREDN